MRAGKRGILRTLIYIWKSISKTATISLQKYHMRLIMRLILKQHEKFLKRANFINIFINLNTVFSKYIAKISCNERNKTQHIRNELLSLVGPKEVYSILTAEF